MCVCVSVCCLCCVLWVRVARTLSQTHSHSRHTEAHKSIMHACIISTFVAAQSDIPYAVWPPHIRLSTSSRLADGASILYYYVYTFTCRQWAVGARNRRFSNQYSKSTSQPATTRSKTSVKGSQLDFNHQSVRFTNQKNYKTKYKKRFCIWTGRFSWLWIYFSSIFFNHISLKYLNCVNIAIN